MVLTVKEFDPGRFGVSSVYHPPLVALYKQLGSRPVWHPTPKLWAFRDESYGELMQQLLAADFPGGHLGSKNVHGCLALSDW